MAMPMNVTRAPTLRPLVLAVSCACLALAGCRESEQARPLEFSPHVYQGEKLPALSAQQTRNLQERGNLQR